MKGKTILAWHIVGKYLINDDPVPADGVTLKWDGPLVMCQSGLHASKRLVDAMQYARGHTTICRVRCGGEIKYADDKFVCRERTILWRLEAEKLFRKFLCDEALSIIEGWNDVPMIVLEYLETQDESKRNAAWYEVYRESCKAPGCPVKCAAVDAAVRAISANDFSLSVFSLSVNKRLTKLVMQERRKPKWKQTCLI